ncbi:DUF6443 domain-containing protein [Pontibacter sp. G13]|uniref:DUF6443 domain-containing protein n=1 Tax=Pontibacter sp. G13 TaxID=3074898 RepID=UPI002889520D|nr:DUF6443 domain-containing protein [Pontibacter sp. G13]WNJ21630.1 DUF6443 domain-containing protein [Pontibacter sp. G13]
MRYFFMGCTLACCLVLPLDLRSQSLDRNHVRVRTARTEIPSAVALEALDNLQSTEDAVTYYDGLGRAVQHVLPKSTPGQHALVEWHAYDAWGLEPRQWLPHVDAGSPDGEFVSDPVGGHSACFVQDSWQQLGHLPAVDRQSAFADRAWESSPLSRPTSSGRPGHAGGLSQGHTTDHAYRTLDPSGYGIDGVRKWEVHPAGISTAGTYAAGELEVLTTTDPNGHRSCEYVDRFGRTVLVRVQLDPSADPSAAGGLEDWASTYRIFDELGRLRAVIQPEGVGALRQNGWVADAALLDNWSLRYRYDHRGRVSGRKVPGADWVFQVYDPGDRPILSQDGNQRLSGKWSFRKYDGLGRVVMTGTCAHPAVTPEALSAELAQHWASGTFSPDESPGTGLHGYGNQAYPDVSAPGTELLTVAYFDGYDFDRNGQLDAWEVPRPLPEMPSLPGGISPRASGLPTGVKIRIMDPDPDMPEWLSTRSYYDKFGREVQTVSDHHLGGQDEVSREYAFTGELVREVRVHTANGQGDTLRARYVHDHRGRPLERHLRIGDGPEVMVALHGYNELGQPVRESLHGTGGGTFLQTLDRRYTLSGQFHSLNDPASTAGLGGEPDLTTAYQLNSLSMMTLSWVSQPSSGKGGGNVSQGFGDFKYQVSLGQKRVRFVRSTGDSDAVPADTSISISHDVPGSFDAGKLPTSVTVPLAVPARVLRQGQGDWRTVVESGLYQALSTSGLSAAQRTSVVQTTVLRLATLWAQGFGSGENIDLFAESVSYETGGPPFAGQATGQYNGNPSGVRWSTPHGAAVCGYGFSFDPMDRLVSAEYGRLSDTSGIWGDLGRFDASYAYDGNGNLTSLRRYGLTGGTYASPATGLMDDLSYTYGGAGNRLQGVSDAVSGVPSGWPSFADGSHAGADFGYDANGNLTQDLDGGILSITYDVLDNPVEYLFYNNKSIRHIYAADGRRLRSRGVQSGLVAQSDGNGGTVLVPMDEEEWREDRVGDFRYRGVDDGTGLVPVLSHVMTREGRVVPEADGWRHEYMIRDHLGNVRVLFGDRDGDGFVNPDPESGEDVGQVSAYYPMGLEMPRSPEQHPLPDNRYLYSGKERGRWSGWYDFGARSYLPTIGRWGGVDPLAADYEPWSPYAFTLGNPVRFVDPDGRRVVGLDGDPVKDPRIRPTNGSGVRGGMFGWTRYSGTKYHNGVDILAPEGSPIQSIKGGTVFNVGYHGNLGNYVVVKSTSEEGETLFIAYGHLSEIGDFQIGGLIEEGAEIGKAGTTGNSVGIAKDQEHVHIYAKVSQSGRYRDSRFVDPLQFFDTAFDESGNPQATPNPQAQKENPTPVMGGCEDVALKVEG